MASIISTFQQEGRPSTFQEPDLTSCDLEPITRLEHIQSFGFLIAVAQDWTVTRVSSNLQSLLGIPPKSALGTKLDRLIDIEALHDIRNRMSGLSASRGVERIYGVTLMKDRPLFDLAVHYAGDSCVLEGELAGPDSRIDAASLVRKMVARLGTLPNLDEFHLDAARQVRLITGFDRVMIYRFSPDGAGEVIAEIARRGMEPFLGLHYPAADIPVQARALYLRNSFRIIADVSSDPIPLLSGSDPAITIEPLDLSLAVTRAVSPIHIEYLRNMGVGASASISIVIEGRLWGLIACHHDTPRRPTFVVRTAAELFGQMYSMTLEGRLRQISDDLDRQGRESVSRLVKSIAKNELHLTDASWLHEATRGMIQSDGLATIIGGSVSHVGVTPPTTTIKQIIQLLQASPPHEIFVTARLASMHCDFAPQSDDTAGVLSIPISKSPGDYIMLFRRAQMQDIKWAGEPSKHDSPTEENQRVSPRKSFAVFSQSVRGQSRRFTDAEQRIAEAIRSGIVEVILRGSPDAEAEASRASGRQELLIAELNHRVRNVLALIRGLISQTQGEGGDSAKYVDSLNGRVQALARAHDRVTRQNWGPGPLNAIFDDEIAAYVPNRRDRFTILGPPILLQPQAYSTLALIIHELVTNSSKYGSLSDSGSVVVTLSVTVGQGLHFKWREFGGPAVKVPTRRGFGSVIIERVVPFDLQGTALVSFLPAGLEAQFFIPERYLAPMLANQGIATPHPAAISNAADAAIKPRPLQGFSVLLLEDNLIVALEAEDLLRALGAESVLMVSTVAAAAQVCANSSIDFAVLDINLGFETSLKFADTLRKAMIPFIFASGYGDQNNSNESSISELTVSKPYDRDYLAVAVANTLARIQAS